MSSNELNHLIPQKVTKVLYPKKMKKKKPKTKTKKKTTQKNQKILIVIYHHYFHYIPQFEIYHFSTKITQIIKSFD